MEELTNGVVKGTEEGTLQPVIAKEYKLEEAGQAHIDIINTKSAAGRLILVPWILTLLWNCDYMDAYCSHMNSDYIRVANQMQQTAISN